MKLRSIREALGLTQKQLSELSRVSQPSISDVENGRVIPNIITASRIANALGCTIDDLLDKQDTQKEDHT